MVLSYRAVTTQEQGKQKGGRHTWRREVVTGNHPGPRMKREKNGGSGWEAMVRVRT
jgi:expansin (peptidoglycan-binding protein)